MKKVLFLFLSVFFCMAAMAQRNDTEQPVYLRFPTVPAFTIYKAPDSTTYTRDKIRKNRPVVFFVFSPDCGHCNTETEKILKNIDQFKNVEIVMVTYLPFQDMMGYYKKHNLGRYSNITVGRDASFFFPTFFNVKFFPSFYIYDKKWNFKKFLEGEVGIDKVLQAINS